VFFVYLIRLAT